MMLSNYKMLKAGCVDAYWGILEHMIPSAVGAYWWKGRVNFGDLITPWLLDGLGKCGVWRCPANASIAATGSILELLPESFRGTVIGSGFIRQPTEKRNFKRAKIIAVRGKLTRAALDTPDTIELGDPGLLVASRFQQKVAGDLNPSGRIGIVPHYVDKHNPYLGRFVDKYPNEILVIDVERPVDAVLEDISRCRAVVSSSLHGVICAHSFGIPSAWAQFSKLVVGDGYKFRDYFSVFDMDPYPLAFDCDRTISECEEACVAPPADLVLEVVDRLGKAFDAAIAGLGKKQ